MPASFSPPRTTATPPSTGSLPSTLSLEAEQQLGFPAVSRLDVLAAAPAGNPSCCSASRESVGGRLPVDGGVAVVLGGLKLAGMLVGGACFFFTISL